MSLEAFVTPAILLPVVLFMWNRINARFDAVDARMNARFDAVNARIDAVARDLDSVARDVAFLAGRQAERDSAR